MSKKSLALWSALSLFALLFAVVAPLSATRPARAQSDDGVVAIINARNPTNALGVAEAKKLFLGQTAFWHGVVPVKITTRPEAAPAAKAFYALLGHTSQSFQKQWDELQLAGRGVSPRPIGPIQDVAAAVAKAPGGISFGLASEAWNLQLKGVKIIPIR